MMPFVSWYTGCVRTQWLLGRMYSYFENGNFMAEIQGYHALKQFVQKGGLSFLRISHTRCVCGSQAQ